MEVEQGDETDAAEQLAPAAPDALADRAVGVAEAALFLGYSKSQVRELETMHRSLEHATESIMSNAEPASQEPMTAELRVGTGAVG